VKALSGYYQYFGLRLCCTSLSGVRREFGGSGGEHCGVAVRKLNVAPR
jgi:hypothetical protein